MGHYLGQIGEFGKTERGESKLEMETYSMMCDGGCQVLEGDGGCPILPRPAGNSTYSGCSRPDT